MMTGADVLIEALLDEGVDTIFGYPGGAVLHIYDALYRYSDRIKHVLTAHEQGAAHAADGYSRSSGRIGVCLATSGPGATNLITGIATAFLDSIPLLAITGNVPLQLLGKDSFQEVDITGMTMAVTKHNFIVKEASQIKSTVKRAIEIATSGRPGPVLIDIPKNLTAEIVQELAEVEFSRPWKEKRAYSSLERDDLKSVIDLISNSKKPLIYAGGGVIQSNSADLLMSFAKQIDAPVATSLMGLGAIPAHSHYSLGMIGMHGTRASNWAVTQCDVLIAIGARFSDRVLSKLEGFAPDAHIIHIDIDPAEINKNIVSYKSLIGQIPIVLQAITEQLEPLNHMEWLVSIQDMKNQWLQIGEPRKFRPKEIIEALSDLTGGNCIVATEVGQNQMWTAQFFPFVGARQMITSGGLGTMGFGMGAAIGAQLANPNRLVINIAGDGCFHMNCNELSTAVTYGLPIKVILLNNGVLGMVRQWQKLFCDERYSQTTLNRKTNYEQLAQAFGAKGYTIGVNDDVHTVLKEALAYPGPVVVNCHIESDELVLPMVPPGASIGNMIDITRD